MVVCLRGVLAIAFPIIFAISSLCVAQEAPFGAKFGAPPDEVGLSRASVKSPRSCAFPAMEAEATIAAKLKGAADLLEQHQYNVRMGSKSIEVCGLFIEEKLAYLLVRYDDIKDIQDEIRSRLDEKYGSRTERQQPISSYSFWDGKVTGTSVIHSTWTGPQLVAEMAYPTVPEFFMSTKGGGHVLSVQQDASYLVYGDRNASSALAALLAKVKQAEQNRSDEARKKEESKRSDAAKNF